MPRSEIETWLKLHGVPQYKSDLGRADDSTEQFGESSKRVSSAVAIAWAAVGAAVIATTRNIVQSSMRLEHSMRNVWTLTDVGKDSLDALKREFTLLSMQIPKTSVDLSQASYQMLSSGVAFEKTARAVEAAGKAATAGSVDTAVAVEAGMGAVNAYSLAIDDLLDVYDIQFATVKQGVLTYEQLASAMGNVFPVASQLGIKLSDLYGTVAFLTTQSQRADMATTNLAAALSVFIDQADKMAELGVNVYDTSGKFRDLLGIIRDLGIATQGTTEHQAKMLKEMGLLERRAFRFIGPAIEKIDKLEEMLKLSANAAGQLDQAVTKMSTDSTSQVDLMKNAWRGFGDLLGDAVSPAVDAIAKSLKFIAETTVQQMLIHHLPFDQILEDAQNYMRSMDLVWADIGKGMDAGQIESQLEHLQKMERQWALLAEHPKLAAFHWGNVFGEDEELDTVLKAYELLEREIRLLSGALNDARASEGPEQIDKLGEAAARALPSIEDLNTALAFPDVAENMPRLPIFELEDLEIPIRNASTALSELNEVQLLLGEEMGGSVLWAFEDFGATVMFNANRAAEAWGRMVDNIIADIGRLLARMAAMKIATGILNVLSGGLGFGLGGGGGLVGDMPGIGGDFNFRAMPSAPNLAAAAPAPTGGGMTVVVHEATPSTWVEITDNVIEPRLEHSKRHRVTEDG